MKMFLHNFFVIQCKFQTVLVFLALIVFDFHSFEIDKKDTQKTNENRNFLEKYFENRKILMNITLFGIQCRFQNCHCFSFF